jgi:hypothetical protein
LSSASLSSSSGFLKVLSSSLSSSSSASSSAPFSVRISIWFFPLAVRHSYFSLLFQLSSLRYNISTVLLVFVPYPGLKLNQFAG